MPPFLYIYIGFNNLNMNKIQETINKMSIDELRRRLAVYMAADKEWVPQPIGIEVRHRDAKDISRGNIYDVIVLKEDGSEETIHFMDRRSKLIYIYTLMHPKGFHRRSLNKREEGFQELANLFRVLFMADPKLLVKSATNNFGHMMDMAISFIRRALKNMRGCEELTIGAPSLYKGRTFIPAVYNGLPVTIDNQLQRFITPSK